MWHAVGNILGAENFKYMLKQVSKKNFKREIVENASLSLVQFKTEWSGVCHIIEPLYRELANSYNGVVNFYTIDVEMEKGIESDYGVVEIPTILIFKSGKVIDYAIGLTSKNQLISKIENAIAN